MKLMIGPMCVCEMNYYQKNIIQVVDSCKSMNMKLKIWFKIVLGMVGSKHFHIQMFLFPRRKHSKDMI